LFVNEPLQQVEANISVEGQEPAQDLRRVPEIPILPPAVLDPPVRTRSGRVTGPPAHLQDFVVYEAIHNVSSIKPDIDSMSPIAFGATSDPDVLYYH
jgi:hypothetical protein